MSNNYGVFFYFLNNSSKDITFLKNRFVLSSIDFFKVKPKVLSIFFGKNLISNTSFFAGSNKLCNFYNFFDVFKNIKGSSSLFTLFVKFRINLLYISFFNDLIRGFKKFTLITFLNFLRLNILYLFRVLSNPLLKIIHILNFKNANVSSNIP